LYSGGLITLEAFGLSTLWLDGVCTTENETAAAWTMANYRPAVFRCCLTAEFAAYSLYTFLLAVFFLRLYICLALSVLPYDAMQRGLCRRAVSARPSVCLSLYVFRRNE